MHALIDSFDSLDTGLRLSLTAAARELQPAPTRAPLAQAIRRQPGREQAVALGYPLCDLERVPQEAVDAFTGTGYCHDFAALQPGERVLEVGSGRGLDSFLASLQVGARGRVTGIGMPRAEREAASDLARDYGFRNVRFLRGCFQQLPSADGCYDCVISNGLVGATDRASIFSEIARVLRRGGRLAASDIVTSEPLPEGVECALEREDYQRAVEAAGLRITCMRINHGYRFGGAGAEVLARNVGAASISLVAIKL